MGVFIKKNNQLVPVGISSYSEQIKPNIYFSSTTAPTDTSKLWIKSDIVPNKINFKQDLYVDGPLTLGDTLYTNANFKNLVTVGTKIYSFCETGIIFDTTNNTATTGFYTPSTIAITTCPVAFGTDIYIFGGGTGTSYGSSYASNIIRKYDTLTNTFTTLNVTLPKSLSYMCGVRIGDYIYICGGYNRSAQYTYDNNSNIYKFDVANQTINYLDSFVACNSRYCGCCAVGTKVYVMSYAYMSTSNSTYMDYSYFDVSDSTKTTRVDYSTNVIPSKNLIAGCVSFGTKIYCFTQFSTGTYNKNLWILDTADHTWTESIDIYAWSSSVSNDFRCVTIVDNKIYLGYYVRTIPLTTALTQNNLLILDGYGTKDFSIVSNDALDIRCSPTAVYLGDSNNEAQHVDAALYDSDSHTWINI